MTDRVFSVPRNEVRKLAVWLTQDVLREVAKWALIVVGIWLILGAILTAFEVGFDSTDGQTRSQMTIRIDCGQRLQYLADKRGGLTPRLDRDGKHMTWEGEC